LKTLRTHWIVFACTLLSGPRAFALNPSLDISQYAHTAWQVRDGFSKGRITSVAQTPDGYLWLGTEFGLLRFDGVRNVPWQPPPGQHLPSSFIRYLLTGRDGTLWIATLKGLVSWKDGTLTQYPELAEQSVDTLLEDHEGFLWAGISAVRAGSLCATRRRHTQCYGSDGSLGRSVESLFEDRNGNLWVGAETGLWRWQPGPPKHYLLRGGTFATSQMLNAGDNGTLLIATHNGLKQLVDGKAEAYPLSAARQFTPNKLLRDRDGGLWIGTVSQGLVHVREGRTDRFAQSEGLSGDFINRFFEDREGNVWVVTNGGLDRFRELAVATFSAREGFSSGGTGAVLATRDGSVWIGADDGLYRVDRQIVVDSGLPKDAVGSLFQDDRGRIWVSTRAGVGYLENGRFTSVSSGFGLSVSSIVEDRQGDVWVANQNLGLLELRQSGEVQQRPWARLGHEDYAWALADSPSGGGLWLGFYQGGIAYLANGEVRASYAAGDGLGEGRVNAFQVDRDGTLWTATDGGLSRLKNGRIVTLTSRNGLPCDQVHWVIEDDLHAFWLEMPCGLVRIARADLDTWAVSVDKDHRSSQTVHATVFDSLDGLRSRAIAGGYTPRVAKSTDGKLWFASAEGVGVVDPRHLPFNTLPPPVQVEQITADRTIYNAGAKVNGRVSLPPLIRDLEIEYTALSLVAPEKNRFKVKLEGWDPDWQDVGTRRQVFYNKLPPRNYRFRVIASNNSGVWNEAGASLDFAIAPAYYQTMWFQALLAMAGLTLVWAAYQYRVRRIAHEFDVRLEERVNERTRVARELHDTLLQTCHGVLFRFQAAVNMLPEHPTEAKVSFENAIDRAAQAIAEARDTVQDLRASTVVTNDLAVAISTLGDELAASGVNGHGTVVHVAVQGTPRDLRPILRDDVYRIVGEALRNAFRHAHAHRIEVEITYDDRQFRVQARDDGKGIDGAVRADERRGHFGLSGMRERAELVGGRLEVWSEVGAGTEIDLTIPATKAYAMGRARWFTKKTGRDA
jgi:signal transduction histidine kinase/ligand-binding sensor domain-containing protein